MKDAADALSLDLLATSYTESARPPPLSTRHVAAYMARVAAGGAPVEQDPAAVSLPPSSATGKEDCNGGGGGGGRAAALLADDGPQTKPLPGPSSWPLFFDGQVGRCSSMCRRMGEA